jgi:hypothetical protein
VPGRKGHHGVLLIEGCHTLGVARVGALDEQSCDVLGFHGFVILGHCRLPSAFIVRRNDVEAQRWGTMNFSPRENPVIVQNRDPTILFSVRDLSSDKRHRNADQVVQPA